MSRQAFRLGALLLAGAALVAPASAKTMNVVASFSVLADVVRQVGGEHTNVRSLVPPNGDPHEYEPTPQDAQALRSADVVFVNGLGLEGWMDRLVSSSGFKGQRIVVSRGIKAAKMEEDGKQVTDPHVWNDPKNVEAWVSLIEGALVTADPEDAADLHAKAKAYLEQLAVADRDARTKLSAIPPARRKVLTSHDALGYMGRAYGIQFLAPVGISTDAEPSARDVARLIQQIRTEHIGAYFIESSNDPRLVEQIAHESGAVSGGVLYVEALSPPDGPAPTYLAMFRYNIDQLVRAMQTGS